MFLWISSIISNVYFLFFGILAIVGTTMYVFQSNAEQWIMTFFVMMIFLFSIGSFIEMSLLKKRIKKQHEAFELHNEIDDIGL
jgi:hypothetical protein